MRALGVVRGGGGEEGGEGGEDLWVVLVELLRLLNSCSCGFEAQGLGFRQALGMLRVRVSSISLDLLRCLLIL